MDIRFTNRWAGFSYMELYQMLDGLIALSCDSRRSNRQLSSRLIHELNEEMVKRQKEGAEYDENHV